MREPTTDKGLNKMLIPSSLILFRFLISPFLLWDALDGETSVWFLVGFIAAVISDIFDGITARRLGVSTARLRQADKWADICLLGCVFVSAWLGYRDLLLAYRVPLLMVIFAQLVWWIVNLAKYGKPANYHTYSGKFLGITLCIAIIALFGFDYAGVTLWLTCIAGTIYSIEEIAMTLILPVWTNDVFSIFHALKIREIKEV